MSTATETQPANLDELIEVLQALPGMPCADRVKTVRALDRVARRILGDIGDEATFRLATETDGLGRRVRTHAAVGRMVGVTADRVNHAITRYRQRREAGGQP